jgi:hypothetical protein
MCALARAEGQPQRDGVRLIGQDHLVARAERTEALLPFVDDAIDGDAIRGTHVGRGGRHVQLGFGIGVARLAGEREVALGGIHHVEHGDVVAGRAQTAHRGKRRLDVDEQVADEDHHPAPRDEARRLAECRGEIRRAPVALLGERRDESAPLPAAGARRDAGAHGVVESDEPHRIALRRSSSPRAAVNCSA